MIPDEFLDDSGMFLGWFWNFQNLRFFCPKSWPFRICCVTSFGFAEETPVQKPQEWCSWISLKLWRPAEFYCGMISTKMLLFGEVEWWIVPGVWSGLWPHLDFWICKLEESALHHIFESQVEPNWLDLGRHSGLEKCNFVSRAAILKQILWFSEKNKSTYI